MDDQRRFFAAITGLRPIPDDWDYGEERQKFYDDLPLICAREGSKWHGPSESAYKHIWVVYWNSSMENVGHRHLTGDAGDGILPVRETRHDCSTSPVDDV